MELFELERAFKNHIFHNEDEIKIHFHSDIIKPLLEELNPKMIGQFKSETVFHWGGRADATFQNISFELKKYGYFKTPKGIEEALKGRSRKDHGLYDYIIENSGISAKDATEAMAQKILNGIGVGFDGKRFLFARFVSVPVAEKLDTEKLTMEIDVELPVSFRHEVKDFSAGLKRLALLLKQQDKIALNKKNLISVINPKSQFVKKI